MLSTHPDPVVTRRSSDRPHRVRWLIAIAAAVALSASSAEAQCPPGSFIVSGSVQGTGGVPLGGYDIDILDAQGNPLDLSQDFTLANGTFTLTVCQVIPAGFYTVVINPPTGSNYFVGTFPNEIIQQGAVLGPFVLTEGVRVTGTVRTETGVAIQSADLQFSDSASGVLVQYSNESTNALGQFDVLIDPGTWDINFRDLPGFTVPVGPYVEVTLRDRIINTSTNLGIITLRNGYPMNGTVLGATGMPLNGADIDLRDPDTGDEVELSGDITGLVAGPGQFSILIPTGDWELEVEPPPGSNLAGTVQNITMVAPGPLNVPTIQLVAGVPVSGVVTNGVTAVPNVDLDFIITATQVEIPTADDNAGPNGAFSVVVAPNTYDIQFKPPFSTGLAPLQLDAVVVSAMTNLGSVALSAGNALTGNITLNGAPLAEARVTLAQAGQPVVTFGNRSNSLGDYALRQVPGIYDVTVTPPAGVSASPVTVSGVDLTTDEVLDVDLGGVNPIPPPPVTGLSCSGTTTDASLTWSNGAGDYDSIVVRRGGIVIATLGGQATSFLDAGLPASSYTYQVRAVRTGLESGDTSCSVIVGSPAQQPFVRGEVNGDGSINIADAIGLLLVLFDNTVPVPPCADALDANDDGSMNIADAIFLLQFLFNAGANPPTPYPNAGLDPTPDALNCF